MMERGWLGRKERQWEDRLSEEDGLFKEEQPLGRPSLGPTASAESSYFGASAFFQFYGIRDSAPSSSTSHFFLVQAHHKLV